LPDELLPAENLANWRATRDADDEIDEDAQDEIMEYFMQSETDDIVEAEEYFDGDYEEEILRLMRIKFHSEVGN
jgi:ATP-dependent DNA helicase RecQ